MHDDTMPASRTPARPRGVLRELPATRHAARQARAVLASFGRPFLLTTGFLLGVVAAARVAGVGPGHFFRDAPALPGAAPFPGLVNQVGVLLWFGAAMLCFFCAGVGRGRGADARTVRFLAWSGLLTAVLALDDLFQFHELILPHYLGVPERVVYGAYLAATLGYLATFGRHILRTASYPLLAVALACFALSMSMDLELLGRTFGLLWEDSFKLLGIVSWLGYFARTGEEAIGAAVSTRPRGG